MNRNIFAFQYLEDYEAFVGLVKQACTIGFNAG